MGVLLRDRDGGEVRVGRDGEPVVRYRLSAYDAGHLRTGMDGAAQILEAPGAQQDLLLPEQVGGLRPGDERRPGSGSWPRPTPPVTARARSSLGSFHIMGSARLGGSPASSACDPAGQTWDVRDLYVMDGSSFPTRVGGQPPDLDSGDRPHERPGAGGPTRLSYRGAVGYSPRVIDLRR